MHLDELAEGGFPSDDQLVREQDGERVVADEVACAPHRMSQPQGLHLAYERELSGIRGTQRCEELGDVELALVDQLPLELIADVEVVLDRRVSATGDEDERFDARGEGLVDGILDQGPVHDGEEHLRHRLRGGQEPRPEARNGEDGRADVSHQVPRAPATRSAWPFARTL